MKKEVVVFDDEDSKTEFDTDYGILLLQVTNHDIENNGIGAYECHGYVGFDRGEDILIPTAIEVLSIDGNKDHPALNTAQKYIDRELELDNIQFQIGK